MLVAGCGASADIAALETLNVRTREVGRGWYRLESGDAYVFDMPGVPLAEPERYDFGGREIRATFYDLSAELDSRGFLVRAFDAHELDEAEREALRREAEAQITQAGEGTSNARTFVERGIQVHELQVEWVSSHGHVAWVRTFVDGPFVFQVTAILVGGAGVPEDVSRFMRSVRATPARNAQ